MIGSKQKRIDELEAEIEKARETHRAWESKYLQVVDRAEAQAIELKGLRAQQDESLSVTEIEALKRRVKEVESIAGEQATKIQQLQYALSNARQARANSEAGFVRLKRKIVRLESQLPR